MRQEKGKERRSEGKPEGRRQGKWEGGEGKHPARSFLSIKVALHGGRNGVGSRFRRTIYHMGSGLPENDS